MKNALLLLISLFFTTVIFSQNNLAPCGQENLSNGFENGLENTSGKNLIVANDLVVNSGENFTLTQLIYHSFHQGFEPIDSVDIIYYADNNGLPGTIIGTENGVIPSSLLDIGDFGLEIYEVTLDVTPFIFEGNSNETIYWIGLIGSTSNGEALYWETTSATAIGSPAAQSFEGVYSIPNPDFDGVYFLSGFCEPLLEVNNIEENLIKIYPNPTKEILNIKFPSNITVNGVKVYNSLGMNMNISHSANSINVKNLANGIYLLKVETSYGILTERFVKY